MRTEDVGNKGADLSGPAASFYNKIKSKVMFIRVFWTISAIIAWIIVYNATVKEMDSKY